MVGCHLILALCVSLFRLTLAHPQHVDRVSSAALTWTNCGNSSDIMHVQDIQISPDPPHVGKSVQVTGHGQVSSIIKEGAYADVNVKSGILTVFSQRVDLCQEARDSGLTIQCPVSVGAYTFDESMTIPSNTPRGKYNVKVNGFTVDHAPMFCLQMTMDLST